MMMRELGESSPRDLTKPDEEFYPAAPFARVTIEVIDPSGLHMRSAGSFVGMACRYQARIWIRHRDACLDAKSILDVLMTAAGCGEHLLIEASGPDAEEAIRALSSLDPICRAV